VFAITPCVGPVGAHPLRRLVERFVGELERAPMRCDHSQRPMLLRRLELGVRDEGIFGIHVHGPHEPARLVCSDWQDCDIERPESGADVPKHRMQGCVTCEKDRMGRRSDCPTAPQSMVAATERPSGKVLCRHAGYAEAQCLTRFHPVAFAHVGCPACAYEISDAEGRVPDNCRVAIGQAGDGRRVEMVIVVMRKANQIDRRQLIKVDGWRN
jgi:hypothetical protein